MSDKPVHVYRATCTWEGTTAVGYEKYDRQHVAAAPPASTTLTLSADRAFRGDPQFLNPEQLLVIAASSCQLLSFLALAARARIEVLEYRDSADAEMPEDDLPIRVSRIRLRPRVVVAGAVTEERIVRLLELAHQQCYIANSLRSEITLHPNIEIRDKAVGGSA